MKKRNLIAFCVALVLVCNFLGVSQSGAWFVSGGSFTENKYDTAQVVYLPALQSEAGYNDGIPKYGRLLPGTPAGGTGANATVYLVPGDSMIYTNDGTSTYPDFLSLENFSTVPTNVQVRIDVTFDNNNYNEKGDITTTDEETASGQFMWKQNGETHQYEYGVNFTPDGATNFIFMPLLRVTFANVAAGGTALPEPYKAITNTDAAYNWNPDNTTAPTAWNLTLNGDAGQMIPAIAGTTKQFYNVLTGFEVVAETLDKSNQDAFDEFFSAYYADHNIKINVKYYAKQIAGEWTLFDNQEIATQLNLSRKQASSIN